EAREFGPRRAAITRERSWGLAENGAQRVVPDVATAQHNADLAARVLGRRFAIGCYCYTGSPLDDHLVLSHHEPDRISDLGFADEDTIVDERTAEIERDRARLDTAGGRVGECRLLRRRDDFARAHALIHGDGVLGPAADNA